MVDPSKTQPDKLAEMCNSLFADNEYLRAELAKARQYIKELEDAHCDP